MSDIHISRADENEAVTPKDVVYDAVEQVYTVIGDGWFVRSDPGDQDVWTGYAVMDVLPTGLVQTGSLYITGDSNGTYFSPDKGVTWHKLQSYRGLSYGNGNYIANTQNQVWIGTALNNLTTALDLTNLQITHAIYSAYLGQYLVSYEGGFMVSSDTGEYESWVPAAAFAGEITKIFSDDADGVLFAIGRSNVLQIGTLSKSQICVHWS